MRLALLSKALLAWSCLYSTGFVGLAHAEEEAATTSDAPPVEEKEKESYVPPENAESFAFEAEVSRMLDIVVNSLYQNKDVFLRELISNAADAIDKYRYLSLTASDEYGTRDQDDELKIEVEYDTDANTLTVRDTGVGMTQQDMIENLGTVARSGTTRFLQALQENKEATADNAIQQIGQFGVGFYSTFLVADRVSVASKSPKAGSKQMVWESTNGASEFLIYPDPRGETLKRGTEITLHLKEDAIEYADPTRLNELARHYSEFVTHPIYLRNIVTEMVPVEDEEDEEKKDDDEEEKKKEDGDDLDVGDDEDIDADGDDAEDKPPKMKEVTTQNWERINSNQAIWTREKDSITDDEYQAFFHSLTDEDFKNASQWTHFNAEGNINFKSILYLPDEVPSSYRYGNMEVPKSAMRLYVQKVLISDEFELLPKYLGFIRGVVDSDDLPLNVNRETLQESKILKVIQKKVVRKAIDLIKSFAKEAEKEEEKDDSELEDDDEALTTVSKKQKYLNWYKQFAPNIKLGVIDDEPNRGKLSKLLRYVTSKSDGELKTLTDYVADMKEWQKEIYVMGGTSQEEIEASPLLEGFKDKDVEVIYMTDALDEYLVQHVREFDGKKFVQASSESVKFKDEDEDLIKRREKAYQAKYKPLTKALRKLYQGTVLRVQVAKRNLGSVPAVVTSSDFGNTANMERILRAQAFQSNQDMGGMGAMKVFEINPRHPLIVKLLDGMTTPEPEVGEDGEEKAAEDPFLPDELVDSAMMMHDMAMLNGGFPIADPQAHNKRMTKVLQKQFELESLDLEPEIDPPVEDDEPPEFDMDAMGGMNMEDFNLDDFDLDSLNMGEL